MLEYLLLPVKNRLQLSENVIFLDSSTVVFSATVEGLMFF